MKFRHVCIALLAFVTSTGVWAQRTLVPLMDFVSIPTSAPGGPPVTADQVKQAISAAALNLEWDTAVSPDGSIAASTVKDDEHFIAVKIAYDATQMTFTYVDSKNLRYVPKEPPSAYMPGTARTYQEAARKQVERFATAPESPFAVQTPGYIHPAYEAWVREFIASIRRRLRAPL